MRHLLRLGGGCAGDGRLADSYYMDSPTPRVLLFTKDDANVFELDLKNHDSDSLLSPAINQAPPFPSNPPPPSTPSAKSVNSDFDSILSSKKYVIIKTLNTFLKRRPPIEVLKDEGIIKG